MDYLRALRWPKGYVCRCTSTRYWSRGRGLMICRDCGYEASVTAGTLFQDTRKPLRLWFQAMWYVVNQKNGVSALGLQKALGLKTYQTAWAWLHKLRRAMVRPGRGGAVDAAVCIEWAPPSAQHLADATSFDVAVRYTTRSGKRAIAGIETKLTEPFSSKSYGMNDHHTETYRRVAQRSDVAPVVRTVFPLR